VKAKTVELLGGIPQCVGDLVAGQLVGQPVRHVRAGPENGLQVLRRLPRLGRVRLIDDDREPLPVQVGRGPRDNRELLKRRDDDLRAGPGQRVSQLLAVLVDPLDEAGRVIELENRVLQLPVEDDTVGHHHDLVEHALVRT
jgi:hypothetical protein